MARCLVGVHRRRHPFDPAPYARPALAVARSGWQGAPSHAGSLDARDSSWVRGLRPEALATWVATFGSALFSILLYTVIWGWPVACGLVAGMWTHELGHQQVARRLRLAVSPIVFVPFIGAVQRLRAQPKSARDGAILALAGPLFGLWFALACKLGSAVTGANALDFLGTAHAALALIDLLPFGLLDGGRVVPALSRGVRSSAPIAAIYATLVITGAALAFAG